MALTPALTPLDRMVLEAVQQRPRRFKEMYPELLRTSRRYCGPRGLGDHEAWAILRGLEHLGLVERRGGGWWVAT